MSAKGKKTKRQRERSARLKADRYIRAVAPGVPIRLRLWPIMVKGKVRCGKLKCKKEAMWVFELESSQEHLCYRHAKIRQEELNPLIACGKVLWVNEGDFKDGEPVVDAMERALEQGDAPEVVVAGLEDLKRLPSVHETL